MNRYLLLLLAGILMQAGNVFAQELAQATDERTAGTGSACAARTAPSDLVRFYPNPVTNKLYITPAEEMNNVLFYVTDARGRMVVNEMIPNLPAGQAFSYSFDALPAGVYVVMLQAENKLITQRIMVQ